MNISAFEQHREAFDTLQPSIKERLAEFAHLSSKDYFYELCFCICTPQSKARNADSVINALKEGNFQEEGFDPAPILRDAKHYIRFHNVKARRLLKIQQEFSKILPILTDDTLAPTEQRRLLVAAVDGLGWKEASHYLRNIGKRGLSIIDRHVLRNLVFFGVFESIPSVSTEKKYYAVEKAFHEFAKAINVDPDELDFYFWYMQAGEIFK